MRKQGFSLIEMLVVLSIIIIVFSFSFTTLQSLKLTTSIMRQNEKYEAISQIYNYFRHLENAIVIKNDIQNNKFFYQMPLLDSDDKIVDPIKGGSWYAIQYQNQKLVQIDPITNNSKLITSNNIFVKSSTFNFDFENKQLYVTLDLNLLNSPKNVRINMVINMLNVLNEL